MLNLLIFAFVRSILRLRYRVRISGVEAVGKESCSGTLFLPNHPGLIDPVILMSQLYPRFRLRPLADQDQMDRPGIRWLAARLGVIAIPDPTRYGEASRQVVEEGVEACVRALRAGSNILLYPSGHIMRQRTEDLAGSSAVETILARLPEVRVILVRTRGVWGSGFSRAAGSAPPVGKVIKKGILSVLANGIFFSPRRQVDIELHEPADLPRQGGRARLNRYLEEFYNQEALPARYVPYTLWEKCGTHDMPEPARGTNAGDLSEVPEATRALVIRHLRELTGKSLIKDEDSLARDLNLDSLALVDVGLWVQAEFGFPVSDGAGMETVGDVLLAARGLSSGPIKQEIKPIPDAWFPSNRPRIGRRLSGTLRPTEQQENAKGRAKRPAEPQVPQVNIPLGTTLTSVFLAQASLGLDRVVLADQSGGVKTYRDILVGILALQPQLERLPGECVGIMLPASAGAGVLYLATLFAGKTPVMVNWTVGVRTMTHSLDLLGVRAVITAGRVVQKIESQSGILGALKERFVLVEELGKKIGAGAKLQAWLRARTVWRRHLASVKVADTAVVLFTSGSESLPKAVPLTHANLLANLRDFCSVFRFRPEDRLIGILPPFHSFGLTCTLLLPLCSGIPVAYHPNPTEGAMLARLIEAYRISLLVGTPTFLGGILRSIPLEGRASSRPHSGGHDEAWPSINRPLRSLRAVITGAEKCPEALFDLIKRQWPNLKVIEGYGITECSPVVSANDEINPQPGTIGKPLPSVETALVDVESGRRVEPGRPGMLLVRGPSIFGGYLKYEGASPFVEFEGKSWYRTGDLVLQRMDGMLVFSGRLKRFIKLGGEMISLPAVEEALAKAYTKPSDDEPVIAVEATPAELNPELVLFTLRDLDREEVNNRIKEAGLSSLHNIRLIRKIERIPVLGTGKIDYRALKGML